MARGSIDVSQRMSQHEAAVPELSHGAPALKRSTGAVCGASGYLSDGAPASRRSIDRSSGCNFGLFVRRRPVLPLLPQLPPD